MSSTQGAAKSAAERNANRHSTIQSLKAWHAEFNDAAAKNSTPLLSEETSTNSEQTEAVSPVRSELPIFTPKPILKRSAQKSTTKKTVSFVDEKNISIRERRNFFEKYKTYFIFQDDVERIKNTVSKPGFYLYFEKDFKISVLVIHEQDKNETIFLDRIAETEKGPHQELAAILYDAQFMLLQITGITKPKEIMFLDISLEGPMRDLILVHCKAYFTKILPSHRETHPVHVFLFSNNPKAKIFATNYFFEEDMRSSFVFDDDSHDAGDVYIVFRDPVLSEEYQSQLMEAKEKKYNLIEIIVEEQDLNINSIIDSILQSYIDPGEDPLVAQFKKDVAVRAKSIAKDAVASKEEFSDRVKIKVAKKIAEEAVVARAKILEEEPVAFKEEFADKVKEMAAEGKTGKEIENAIEKKVNEKIGYLQNRCVSIYEKMILSDLVRVYIVANMGPKSSRKKRFLAQISTYCRGESDLATTIKAVKEIYMSSYYNGYHVKSLSAQEPISSTELSQIEVKPASMQEPIALCNSIQPEVKADENLNITALKKLLDDMANKMLSEAGDLEFKKKIAEKFAKIHAVIDACPDVVLGYYETYQCNLKKIDEDIQSKKKEKELETMGQTKKNKALEDLMGNIKQHYSIYCANSSKSVEVLSEQSGKEESISVGEEIQVVLEIEEYNMPIDTVVEVELNEPGESQKGKKSEKATPFWAEPQVDRMEEPVPVHAEGLAL